MKTDIQQQENVDALAKKGTCIEFFSAYQDMDVERMLKLMWSRRNRCFRATGGRLYR